MKLIGTKLKHGIGVVKGSRRRDDLHCATHQRKWYVELLPPEKHAVLGPCPSFATVLISMKAVVWDRLGPAELFNPPLSASDKISLVVGGAQSKRELAGKGMVWFPGYKLWGMSQDFWRRKALTSYLPRQRPSQRTVVLFSCRRNEV